MADAEASHNIRRAELARARLAHDLSSVVKAGDRLVQRGKSAVRKAVPLVIGAGVLALLVIVAAGTRRKKYNSWTRSKPPSALGQLVRKAAISAIGVLASRFARSVPLPELGARTSSPRRLRRGDFDPMAPKIQS